MLRSLLIAFVATFYLLFSSGLVVNVHYCMDAIASVSFGHEGDHGDGSCSKCGMDKGVFDCCKDEVREVKLEDVHQPTSLHFWIQSLSTQTPLLAVDLLTAPQGYTAEPLVHYDIPPPREHNKVYRSLNVFRI